MNAEFVHATRRLTMSNFVGYVFIMRGVTGSGKTDFAHFLEESFPEGDVAVHAFDDRFMKYGGYRHGAMKGQYHERRQVLEEFQEDLRRQLPIVIFNHPNLQQEDYEPFVRAAVDAGYRVWITEALPHPDPNEAAERNRFGATEEDIRNQMRIMGKWS